MKGKMMRFPTRAWSKWALIVPVAGVLALGTISPAVAAHSPSFGGAPGVGNVVSWPGKNIGAVRQSRDDATPESRDDSGSEWMDDFIEAGLIDDVSYESPQFGYSIVWEEPWLLNPDDDAAVISDPDGGTDELYLATEDPGFSLLGLIGIDATDSVIADYVDGWATDEFLEEYGGPDTEVLLSDSSRKGGATVTVGPFSEENDVEVVTIREVIPVDGGDTFVLATLIIPSDIFEDVYDSVQESVVIDDESTLGFFSTDEILDELP